MNTIFGGTKDQKPEYVIEAGRDIIENNTIKESNGQPELDLDLDTGKDKRQQTNTLHSRHDLDTIEKENSKADIKTDDPQSIHTYSY